jgi:hypothetical protein
MCFRKIVLFIFVIALILSLCACEYAPAADFQSGSSNPINAHSELVYSEEVISEVYHLVPEEPAATFNASYPVFEDPRYKDFNRAIMENEVSRWEEIFVEICKQADDDVAADPSSATFSRFIEATYEVAEVDGEIHVTFDVIWRMTICNYEPSYQRTYTFSDGMVYATTVTTERVY